MECTSCGAQIDCRAAFCPKCGEITSMGQPFSQKLADALFELGEGLGKVVNAAVDYATDDANRRKVVGGGIVVAFLLVVFTENPISNGTASIFEAEEPEPQMTTEGLPDLANYADVFLSEEMEYFVTGPANVRDFPTSEGTQVVNAIAKGETVKVREVKAFDPSSQWFKLTSGGYVWGGNLAIGSNVRPEIGLVFPDNLQGRWSSATACSEEVDDMVYIQGAGISFWESTGVLREIESNATGNFIYTVEMEGEGQRWTAHYEIFLSADGRSIALHQPDQSYPLHWVRDEGLLGCE